jgi:hypothetical protein
VNSRHTFKSFINRWRHEVRKVSQSGKHTQGKRAYDTHWEGELAYLEFEREGLLPALLFERRNVNGLPRRWQLHAAIREISTEMQNYADHMGKVVQKNYEFRGITKFLNAMAYRFLKERNGLEDSDMRKLLTQYSLQFEADRDRLLKCQKDRQNKIWDNPPGAMGKILISHTYKKRRPVKEDDLDTLFQIRIAQILRTFFPKKHVSRETISRLVVLIYLVGELVEQEKDRLLIRHTNRELKIIDVTQRLRRAGVK